MQTSRGKSLSAMTSHFGKCLLDLARAAALLELDQGAVRCLGRAVGMARFDALSSRLVSRCIRSARAAVFGIVFSMLLAACAELTGARATDRAINLARAHSFSSAEVEGRGLRHTVLSRLQADDSDVWVFIEGDGSPWIHEGREIADDATARNPLALRLALQTPGSVLYLGRPCYLRARTDARCDAALWTRARYSEAVVSSMNAALRTALATRRVVLVGYSGGGTLAALMARTNEDVVATVTIAGNLDVAEWSTRHHYLPLSESRNPADDAPLPSSLVQVNLVGERDTNVSPSIAERYLSRLTKEQVWRFPKFDHVCCWEKSWPEIRAKIQDRLDSAAVADRR